MHKSIIYLAYMLMLTGTIMIMTIRMPEVVYMEEADKEIVPLGILEESELPEEENSINLPFEDVKEHWALEDINYVYENKIMSGLTEKEFGPDSNITRAMFITVLGRMEEKNFDTDIPMTHPYKDVASDKYYDKYVAWAYTIGLLSEEEEYFRPTDALTREDMAVIVRNYLEKVKLVILTAGNDYSDIDEISEKALESVMLLKGSGYVVDDKDNLFKPKKEVIRAEVANIIHKMEESKE